MHGFGHCAKPGQLCQANILAQPVDNGGVDDRVFPDVDVISDGERKEGHSLAELLEGRPDYGLVRDDAVTTDPDVGQVTPVDD